MKNIKNFENFTEQDVKNMLLKSQKKNDIEIKTSIDDVIKNITNSGNLSKMGTFEDFVEQEGRFISVADQKRMPEYVQKFKELGLNTKKVEELLPKFQRYVQIEYKEIDKYSMPVSTKEEAHEYGKKLNQLYDESEKLLPFVDEMEKEIKILAKKAKEL
jgi:hypothetical protein